MMVLNAVTRYKLRKVAKYALVSVVAGAVLMLFSGQGELRYLAAWALLGTWTGVLEEFLFGRRFRALAVPLQFVGKVFAVNLFTVAFITIAFMLNSEHVLPFGDSGRHVPQQVMVQREFYRIVLQVTVVNTIAILVVQMEEIMGRRMFVGFMLGHYERPVSEQRVVLTIDLVGSTALNERLGDMQYYRFLNTTYSLMTDAVLRNDAEILKYMGDEVMFTWGMRGGTRHLHCLDLFFDIQERLAAHEAEMMLEFGAVPRFRGAVHGGPVIVARVGHIKRGIDLSGDTMNTVSRLLGLAKDAKVSLLASSELLERMPSAGERFSLGEEQVLPVKGRKRSVAARSVERKALG